jgi:uncharacterized membrane protein YdbT with pleckstrin-like domain
VEEAVGYIEENLISGEAVTYRGRLHWKVVFWPGVSAVVFTGLGIYLLWRTTFGSNTAEKGGAMMMLGAAAVLIGIVPFAMAQIKRASSEFAVTNKRVIVKTGLIKRKTMEMFLHKIESVSVDQSVPGRMLGYGTLALHGTGGTSETFHDIDTPLEFRRQVQEQIGKNEPGGTAAPNRGPAGG